MSIKKDKWLILNCCIIFMLQFLSFVFKPLIYVEFAYLLALMVFDKFENKMCYLFFMLPFYNVFRYQPDKLAFDNLLESLKSLYLSTILVLAFCLVVLVKYVKDLIKKNKTLSLKSLIIWGSLYLLLIMGFLLLLDKYICGLSPMCLFWGIVLFCFEINSGHAWFLR